MVSGEWIGKRKNMHALSRPNQRVEFDIGPRYINYFREKYRENRDLSNELSFMIVY
jgi:hypothetical protein